MLLLLFLIKHKTSLSKCVKSYLIFSDEIKTSVLMWTRPVIEKHPLFVLRPEDENTSVHSKKTTRLQRYDHLLPSSERFIIIIIIIGSIRIRAHLK